MPLTTRATGRRGAAALPALALVLLAVVAAPTAAAAAPAEHGLAVSLDGRSWGRTIDRPLLTVPDALVPLGGVEGGFWARNDSAGTATLRVSIEDLSISSQDFADHLELVSSADTLPRDRVMPLGGEHRCDVVLPATSLEPGETVRVDLALRMIDTPAQLAQEQRIRMELTVSLADAAVQDLPVSACDDEGVVVPVLPAADPAPAVPATVRDPLAVTGADLPLLGLGAGIALLLAGVLAVARRRRRT